jgi:hypothetical protein
MQRFLVVVFCSLVVSLAGAEVRDHLPMLDANRNIFITYLEQSEETRENIAEWSRFLVAGNDEGAHSDSIEEEIDMCLCDVFAGVSYGNLSEEYSPEVFIEGRGTKIPFSVMQLATILGRKDIVDEISVLGENVNATGHYNRLPDTVALFMHLVWTLAEDDVQEILYHQEGKDWLDIENDLKTTRDLLANPQEAVEAPPEGE